MTHPAPHGPTPGVRARVDPDPSARRPSPGGIRGALHPRGIASLGVASRTSLSAIAVLLAGCVDLALEPDQIPHSLEVTPADARIRVGDEGAFSVIVRDADGEIMPGPPSWTPVDWHLTDPPLIDFAPDGAFSAFGSGDMTVRARVAGLTGWTSLLISPTSVRLDAPAIYLTQAVQTPWTHRAPDRGP